MKVAIVNDMQTSLITLRYILEEKAGWEVLWQAEDGKEAIEACAEQLPEMIIMDLMMPVMNGIEATRIIVQEYSCPVVIVTAGVDKNSTDIFEALAAGAIDSIDMPAMNKDDINTFINKLNIVVKKIESGLGCAKDSDV